MRVVINVTNPLVLSAILVVISFLVGVMVIQIYRSWFFYVLVLVFLGGVIVLVVYMCTLCSNEKFGLNLYSMWSTGLAVTAILMIVPCFPARFDNGRPEGLVHLYEYGEVGILVFLIGFLMVTLICVVKLVKFESGPLVKRL